MMLNPEILRTAWIILIGIGLLMASADGADSPLQGPHILEKNFLETDSGPQKLPAFPTDGARLETALSIDLVDIDTDFSGADLLLFGSVQAGTDIVVVVRGPPTDAMVRHKHRQAGIWVNAEEWEYKNIPAYYHLASNRPLAAFVPAQDQHSFELDRVVLGTQPGDAADSQGSGFEESDSGKLSDQAVERGLIDDMKERGFYGQSENGVIFVGSRLFRMDLRLPPDVPVGAFTVTIFAFRDGVLQDMGSTDFSVGKIGIGAALYSFAHHHPFLYGIVAVFMAVGLGGLSAAVFRTL